MKWDVFRPRGKSQSDPLKEAIENHEKAIEKFAPREHRRERATYYYNYKMMPLYQRPLLIFLQTVSKRERLKREPAQLAGELFVSLKDFYDPKRKTTSEGVVEDPAFRRKFEQMYHYFYGIDSPLIQEISQWHSNGDQ